MALHTLGCRLNSSETAFIAQGFKQRGYHIVPFDHRADIVFINTCTVTNKADSTCRNLIRKATRISPEARIVVAGCYAQMEANQIKSMQGVDLVLGNSEKYRVFDYLEEEAHNTIKIEQDHQFWTAHSTLAGQRTRAFLKIQDGCNYVCSFCIIPFARGRSRTLPVDSAIEQASVLVQQGFQEIVLTGVNIGEYDDLYILLDKLSRLHGLQRIRLSSIEPNTITKQLLEVMAGSHKFLDHFHIPLQSGK